ncbi:MAG: sigma-70 family RNA polymerase sigma factor [Planctomycetaceae bacterium]|nr:MAG: sigma-70 family RNA polymerase sigma factor [Planctomycetaceae bacterium]
MSFRGGFVVIETIENDSDELVRRAAAGDRRAEQTLYGQHRQRLKRMICVRIDQRVAGRVDPSDIVQETLAEAARQLPDYARQRPLPLYPWLRQLALSKVREAYRRHVQAAGRSVQREADIPLPDHSAMDLARCLASSRSGPSRRLLRGEQRQLVRQTLERLGEAAREVLVLRFLEQMSVAETAAVLGLSESGVRSRQRRALEQFCRLFEEIGDAR